MKNYENKTRHIGIEFEFAGISPARAAALVADVYGGQVQEHSPYKFTVEQTPFGKFTVELDTQYAHPKESLQKRAKNGDIVDQALASFDSFIADFVGEASQGIVPCEIVTPPIPTDKIETLTSLMASLTEHKAEDTRKNPWYAFGMHLNPEITSLKTESILAHLQAFVLLEDWLRDAAHIDTTRELLPHISPFPKQYARLLVHPRYKPDQQQLIRDYIHHNPTRNRDLDMLCLFKWLDADLVNGLLPETLIKARPTFHYRLPDFRLSDKDWSIQSEWNRWLEVEKLARDPSQLMQLATDFELYHKQPSSPPEGWVAYIKRKRRL